ncbi:MAG: S8 family peptidase [Clostridiales bacterium]|nr:S8 family peptidase [Clostridiales bacterium]
MTCKERALSEDYVEIMTDFMVTEELLSGKEVDMCTIPAGQGIYISYVSSKVAGERMTSTLYFLPQCYGLMAEPVWNMSYDTVALSDTGILQTQNPPLSLTGRGVVMGFLDTGIRYENAAFRYSDGTTRIRAIWDQTIQEGEPPAGQIFGTEYTRTQINAALAGDTPAALVPVTDRNGHGTALASVAAGSVSEDSDGTVKGFLGAAPDAEIVVVKLREAKTYLRNFLMIPEDVPAYSESDIILALKYLNDFAISLRRPLVICFGLGTNMGSHTGTTILSRYMRRMLERRSRAIVVCGGNEGNSGRHYEGRSYIERGEPYTDVEIRVAEGVTGFVAEVWGTVPQLYTVSILSPSGERYPENIGILGQNFGHSFLYEKTNVNVVYSVVEEGSGDERILIRFDRPTAGLWTIRLYGIGECTEDLFHIWLPIQNFLPAGTYFLRSTPYVTLTVPGYADEIITVTTYNDENHSFWPESGRGFGRNGKIRPDLAAPGVNVPTVNGRMSGSSIAAAITAGAAAQLMQWAVVERNDEYIFGRDVRNYLIRGAQREDSLNYPNREWGFGRLNIESTFEVLRGLR